MRKKSKIIAILLAVFGGSFGLHKFYLRDPSAGIFYIVLTFITARIGFPVTQILGFIDAFSMLMMSQEKFDRKYNADFYQRRTRHSKQNRYRPVERKPTQNPYEKPVPRAKANPFKKSGIKKYKEFDIDEAIVDFEKGLEIEPNDVSLHFNLACAYSLDEKKDKSFYHLEKAVANGLTETNKILEHDDLAFMRIQPEWQAFKDAGFKIAAGNTSAAQPRKDDRLLSQLNKLEELRKKGLLAEKEYQVEKEKLMRS